MKAAISTDNNNVSEHFGRCPSFTLVEIEGEEVKNKEIIDNPGHHPGYLPEFMKSKGVECIIAGGMGMRAQAIFNDYGIKAVVGVTGTVDEVIEALSSGTLKGGESLCRPGVGKESGYGIDKTEAVIEGKEYKNEKIY